MENKKKIIILGPFCTGTNLLENIFKSANIPTIPNEHNKLYWKHNINPNDIEKICLM